MTRTILCFGDSNTWGYTPVSGERYPFTVRWTGVMARKLGDQFAVLEEGQNGRTTVWEDPIEGDKNGLRHLPVLLESHQPLDLVILMLGTNDLKARFSLTAFDIAAGAERLAKLVLDSGYRLILTAPPPVAPTSALEEMFQGAQEKSARLAFHFAQVAERSHCGFIDVGSILSVDPQDGIHYSPESHQKLGEAMAGVVRSILR